MILIWTKSFLKQNCKIFSLTYQEKNFPYSGLLGPRWSYKSRILDQEVDGRTSFELLNSEQAWQYPIHVKKKKKEKVFLVKNDGDIQQHLYVWTVFSLVNSNKMKSQSQLTDILVKSVMTVVSSNSSPRIKILSWSIWCQGCNQSAW